MLWIVLVLVVAGLSIASSNDQYKAERDAAALNALRREYAPL